MTSPWLFKPKHVGAEPRRQRADQVHRRSRQRAGRKRDRHRPASTGRATRTSCRRIAVPIRRCGGSRSSARKGLRDLGGTLSAEQAHHSRSARKRSRCAWTRQCANARALADFLSAHPRVRNVYYPGLAVASAARASARALPRLRRAALVRARSGARRLRVPQSAEASSCCRATSATTARSPSRSRIRSSGRWARSAAREMGIDAGLIRVSVGIEDVDDLIATSRRRCERERPSMPAARAATARIAVAAIRAHAGAIQPRSSRLVAPVREHDALAAVGRRPRARACAGRCVCPWIMRATPKSRNVAATAPSSTSMIDSGFSDVASRLLRRSHRAIRRRTNSGRREQPSLRSRIAHARAVLAGMRRRRCTARRHAKAASACRRGRRVAARAAVSHRSRREARAEHEVAVAVRDIDGNARLRDAADRRGDSGGERLPRAGRRRSTHRTGRRGCTRPRRCARGPGAERVERRRRRRPLGREVKVRKEQQRLHRCRARRRRRRARRRRSASASRRSRDSPRQL